MGKYIVKSQLRTNNLRLRFVCYIRPIDELLLTLPLTDSLPFPYIETKGRCLL
jgi:hypothetical protein